MAEDKRKKETTGAGGKELETGGKGTSSGETRDRKEIDLGQVGFVDDRAGHFQMGTS